MLKIQNGKQLSIFSMLYDRIPENHLLKQINSIMDFSFINNNLKSSYCEHYGRPAKEPEMMCRLLILQELYNLSDEQVIEDAKLNLAYMWFVGVNPDEDLPEASLLSKFRTQRLGSDRLDDILEEIVRQAINKGFIKGTGLSIDATHIAANTIKKVPERVMKHLAKKIFKTLEKEAPEILEKVNTEIPNYKDIEDHKEAKKVMKEYVENLADEVKKLTNIEQSDEVKKVIAEVEEVFGDEKFIEQKGIR